MNCDHSTIMQHLHSMGKVKKSGIWVPQALSQNHKNQRVAICAPLLARHRLAHEQHRPFLSCIVIGDEKWCLYANIRKRKKLLSPNKLAKTCAHPQKLMLCIWWSSDDVLYYEFLPRGVTIIAVIYFQQLRRLADTIQEKRPTRLLEVMLLHDNARPHSANLTKTYMIWVGKSFRTHLIHLILRSQIFTFSALYRTTFKELPFRMMTSTQNHVISTGAESKNYSSIGRLL